MATKDAIVGQIFLRLSGGVVTTNSSVKWGDIDYYLSAAFNYVQLGTYWVENKAEMEHTINPLCLIPFDNVPILFNSVRQRYYATLPAPVVALPKGRALEISTEGGQRLIPLTQGQDAMQEYYGKNSQQIKYQLEGTTTVWFYGMENNPLLAFIRPKYIASIGDIPGDSEVLLAADGLKNILDLTYAWMSGEKQMPKQYAETGKDGVNS